MIAEEIIAPKSQQINSAGLQSQTQTVCYFKSKKKNHTETTANILPTEITEISLPASFTPIPYIDKLVQLPSKIIRGNPDFHFDLRTPEKFASQDNSIGATLHQFRFQSAAIFQFSQFKRTQIISPMCNPFTD